VAILSARDRRDPVIVKVISFLATLPAKMKVESNLHQEKPQTLIRFAQGAGVCGDDGQVHTDMTYQDCDVAVMLGWVHEHGKQAPHLAFRQEIIDQQKRRGGRVVIADSNLFLYKDTSNPHRYLRYSFDGIFPSTGEYCDQTPDPSRWSAVQAHMQVSLAPWRSAGTYFLFCLQRNGGWSMSGFDVVDWALITAKKIRQHSDRPIRIRPHPGDKRISIYCSEIESALRKHGIKDVVFSDPKNISLSRDFKHCWAVVNHNSSPAVAAAIEGIPVFLTDPVQSQAREIANTDFSAIENPVLPDRQAWAERISQSHWSHEDLSSGLCWQHMRRWVKR
jgi:hypothetical protein